MHDQLKSKKKRTLSRQDKQMGSDITSWGIILNKIQQDEDLMHSLSQRGYPAETVASLLKKQEESASIYNNRAKAIQTREKATKRKQSVLADIKQAHLDFRQILRRPFKDKKVRQHLFLSGRLPTDMTLMVSQIKLAYTYLLEHPEPLKEASRFGYTEATIKKLLDRIEGLHSITTIQDKAHQMVLHMREVRDDRYKLLREEMLQFLAVARVISRDHPRWTHLL